MAKAAKPNPFASKGKMTMAQDDKADRRGGIKENSARDKGLDKKRGVK